MPTLDAIKSEIESAAKTALAKSDPAMLRRVEECMIIYNTIQQEIHELDRLVDKILPPEIPNITVTRKD